KIFWPGRSFKTSWSTGRTGSGLCIARVARLELYDKLYNSGYRWFANYLRVELFIINLPICYKMIKKRRRLKNVLTEHLKRSFDKALQTMLKGFLFILDIFCVVRHKLR